MKVILDYSWEEKWVEEKRYSWSNMMEKGGLKKPLLTNRSEGKDSLIALVRERIQEPPTKFGIWFFNFWSPPEEELHAEGIKGESAPLGVWRKRVFALLAGGRAGSQ